MKYSWIVHIEPIFDKLGTKYILIINNLATVGYFFYLQRSILLLYRYMQIILFCEFGLLVIYYIKVYHIL